jgi:Cu(I)/Ag(I) efflux system membrane protein CusA/SilA
VQVRYAREARDTQEKLGRVLVTTTFIVFSGVTVAWSGGFLLLWLYGRPGFLDFEIFGHNFQQLFQVSPINLSTAVWVGFLALFGIATDDGVVMSTYLKQRFEEVKPKGIAAIRQAVVDAGCRRVRPCLMTTATTMLALLPVLTSTGRGSDLMAPMAVPIFGGMLIALMTMFVVPVLYSAAREMRD